MEPLSPEQAQRICDAFQRAAAKGQEHAAHFRDNPYRPAWAALSGILASLCSPHVPYDAFPDFIPPQPTQETTQ